MARPLKRSVTIRVHLTPDERRAARSLAEREDIPLSTLVRRLLRAAEKRASEGKRAA